jgi:tetratricopeptide (TPR) repeat protein
LFRQRGLALAAGAICALAGPLIVFDGQLLSGSLDVFLQLGAPCLLLWAGRRSGSWRWALAGFWLGLGIVNRGGLVLYLPLALIWVGMCGRASEVQLGQRSLRHDLGAMAALLLPVFFLVAPVAWHNAKTDDDGLAAREMRRRVAAEGGRRAAALAHARGLENLRAGRFTLLGAVGGLNFRLGNHWEYRALNDPGHPQCFAHYMRLRGEPVDAGIVSAAEESRFHRIKALEHIAAEPVDFVKVMGLKLFQLIHGAEIARNVSIYAQRESSWVSGALLWKRGLAFPSGLIVPFGLLGLYLARSHWRRQFPVMALLVAQAVFIAIFFVTSRYRLACLPLLAIYASYAGVELGRRFAAGGIRAVGAPIAWLALLLLISNWNVGPMQPHGAFEHARLAKQLRARGELGAAEEHLRRAAEVSPGFPEGRAGLALLLLERGKLEEGVERFRREYTAGDPDEAIRRQRIAVLDRRVRDLEPEQAAAVYRQLFEAVPGDAVILRRLAHSAVAAPAAVAPETLLAWARAHDPDDARLFEDVSQAAERAGRLTVAVTAQTRVAALDPCSSTSEARLLALYRGAEDPAGILTALEGAVHRCPRELEFRNDLAWFLASADDDQLRDGRRALALAKTLPDDDPRFLATRAAADAELGNFEEATVLMRRALEDAGADQEASFRQQLNRYAAQKPWREVAASAETGP